MSTVPLLADYYFSVGTSMKEITGVAVDRSDDGQVSLRDLYAQSLFEISASFGVRPRDQQELLLAFFRANRLEDILIDLNGTSYLCKVVRAPEVRYEGGPLATVTVGLLGRLA